MHATGIESLLRIVTPNMFINEPNHKIFLFCRSVLVGLDTLSIGYTDMVQILKALVVRSKTLIDTPEWMTEPWEMHAKSLYHQLLDLAAEAASLLESCDNSQKSQNVETAHAQRLLHSIMLLILRLKNWRAQSGVRIPRYPPPFAARPRCKSSSPSANNQHSDNHWYPRSISTEDQKLLDELAQARLVLFHCAVVLTLQTCIFANDIIFSQYQTLCAVDTSQDSSKESVLRYAIAATDIDSATALADSITAWFPFSAQDVGRSFGSAYGAFCLKCAISWYEIYLNRSLTISDSHSWTSRHFHLDRCRQMLKEYFEEAG